MKVRQVTDFPIRSRRRQSALAAFWGGFFCGGLFLVTLYVVARLGSALAGHTL